MKTKNTFYIKNTMKFPFIIQLFIAILICTSGCSKKQNDPIVYSFPGIVQLDDNGVKMGTWGTDDGDWKTDSSWSEEEYNLLTFPDTISLNNTYIKDTTGWDDPGPGIHHQPQNIAIAYPNPVKDQVIMILSGFGLIKFKAVIVDKYHNILFSIAAKNSDFMWVLDISDTNKFQNGNTYRMYYSFSTSDSLNFYKGHGDILICRESETDDCKKYVQ